MLDVLQFKHEAYRYEKEIRIFVPQNRDEIWIDNPISLRLPIKNLNLLILSVVVAPEAEDEFFNAVKEFRLKYDLQAKSGVQNWHLF